MAAAALAANSSNLGRRRDDQVATSHAAQSSLSGADAARNITEITLEREPGKSPYPSPWYAITIRSDGAATYVGKSNTDRIGLYEAVVEHDVYLKIGRLVRQAHFDRLARYYGACCVADVPRIYVTVVSHGKVKTVEDDGKPVDPNEKEAPKALVEIERQIDSSVAKLKWRFVNAGTDFPKHSK